MLTSLLPGCFSFFLSQSEDKREQKCKQTLIEAHSSNIQCQKLTKSGMSVPKEPTLGSKRSPLLPFLLLNPYAAFVNQRSSFSPIHSIRQLIRHTPKEEKEYVQSTWFDQHPIPTTIPNKSTSAITKNYLLAFEHCETMP